ncbi:MAG: hypothetical protein A2Y76_02150 [Planctomycetes bacterium RBG_13_60_9]|nr:MAG: hypothetical protein A2Y76_02150 [Planctomycetes bacterium RBG_13_60_9]
MNGTFLKVMISGLLVVNTVLVVFVCNMVFALNQKVETLGAVATKSDLIALASPSIELASEGQCTRCHTERRFAGMPLDEEHRSVLLQQHVRSHNVPESEIEKIQASLTVFDYSSYLTKDMLQKMVLMTDDERMEVLLGIPEMTLDRARQVLKSYKMLLQM